MTSNVDLPRCSPTIPVLYHPPMRDPADIDKFIADWRDSGGSELANTQSFIDGLCRLLGVGALVGSSTEDAHNDYVLERRMFQDKGEGTQSCGWVDGYRRNALVLEAKQRSEPDRAAAEKGEDDLDLFGQTANAWVRRGTARHGLQPTRRAGSSPPHSRRTLRVVPMHRLFGVRRSRARAGRAASNASGEHREYFRG